MMEKSKDLISRADAIDALNKLDSEATEYVVNEREEVHGFCTAVGVCVGAIALLPSAEQVTGKLKKPCDSLLTEDTAERKEQKSKLDFIRRQDAVNEIHKYFVEEINKTPYTKDEDGDEVYTDISTVNSLLVCNKELSKRIKSLPSASVEVGEWIQCSERLPSENGRYLVTYPLFVGGNKWVNVLWYGKPSMPNIKVKGKCWYRSDDEYGDVVYDDILAWMPLPKPYKGGDDE